MTDKPAFEWRRVESPDGWKGTALCMNGSMMAMFESIAGEEIEAWRAEVDAWVREKWGVLPRDGSDDR
jgi:hypothetical protein